MNDWSDFIYVEVNVLLNTYVRWVYTEIDTQLHWPYTSIISVEHKMQIDKEIGGLYHEGNYYGLVNIWRLCLLYDYQGYYWRKNNKNLWQVVDLSTFV